MLWATNVFLCAAEISWVRMTFSSYKYVLEILSTKLLISGFIFDSVLHVLFQLIDVDFDEGAQAVQKFLNDLSIEITVCLYVMLNALKEIVNVSEIFEIYTMRLVITTSISL